MLNLSNNLQLNKQILDILVYNYLEAIKHDYNTYQ